MISGEFLLGLSVVTLFVGPALLWFSQESVRMRTALDGMILTLVLGICLLYLGPHALDTGGWIAFFGIAIGAGLPVILHRLKKDRLWLGAALLTLGTHAFIDGATLSMLNTEHATGFSAAVIAHRLPVGLAVSLRADRPRRAGIVLLGLSVLTSLGFGLGAMEPTLPQTIFSLLEGMIVGGLLHVVVAHRISVQETVVQAVQTGIETQTSTLIINDASCNLVSTECAHDHAHEQHGHDHAQQHDHAQHHDHAQQAGQTDHRMQRLGLLGAV